MEKCECGRHVFPLTSLQIGDLQSYLSDLSLFLAHESKKFYILVDNRPWLQDLVSRPAHIWQLMVTKSRLSPFANTRGRKGRKVTPELKKRNSKLSSQRSQKFKQWFSMIDVAALSKKRALLPVKKLRSSLLSNSQLQRTLYGFIVFEVAWKDVRGINYLNELQTDTSLAIEAKFMRRWEFDSVAQAARCISSWFPGTPNERFLLEDHLNSTLGDVFYDAPTKFSSCSSLDDDEGIPNGNICREDEYTCSLANSLGVYTSSLESETSTLHSPPPDGPYKRRKISEFLSSDVEVDFYNKEAECENLVTPMNSHTSYASDSEDTAEANQYTDVLLLFRFNDRDLPFKLKEIIMSDLRLLTLLEAGLPSWVIFLQSYPVFCHLYRPWMCPLARALYVLISLVTVLIGFYDLYKNVPVLKATASRLCGPLFDWIETWEMVSRIKYLGTMLFLHNSEKAVKWFLMMTSTTRSFITVLTQPLAGPFLGLLDILLPFWSFCVQVGDSFCSFIWILMETSWNLLENLMEFVLLPVWFIFSVVWNIMICVMYPILWSICEILYAPVRLILGLSNLMVFICTHIYNAVGNIWMFTSGIFKFASSAEATVTTYEVSLWRSLWNDLFSQIFRAIRSILHGFIAFFTACNRHRLSIYNHAQEFIRRHYQPLQRSQHLSFRRREHKAGTHTKAEAREERPVHIKHKKQI